MWLWEWRTVLDEIAIENELAVMRRTAGWSCWRRRHVKEILGRMLDPFAAPFTEEAAAFWLTDSSDHRKMLIHRREHSVLEQCNRKRQPEPESQADSVNKNALRSAENALSQEPHRGLPTEEEARKLFESIWDLDRILGYLVMEYLHPGATKAAESLEKAAVFEIERFRAGGDGAGLMPLHYALGALKAALRKTRQEPAAVEDLLTLLTKIEQPIDESRPRKDAEPALDKSGQVRRTIDEIRTLLRRVRDS